MTATYHVEQNEGKPLEWQSIWGTKTRSRQFCEGWVSCAIALFPDRQYRIVHTDERGVATVVLEIFGSGKVQELT